MDKTHLYGGIYMKALDIITVYSWCYEAEADVETGHVIPWLATDQPTCPKCMIKAVDSTACKERPESSKSKDPV